VDFAEKYHKPESSFLPKTVMGLRTAIRAGDSFEYDIPGTYGRPEDLYFLDLGVSKTLNNHLEIGIDAYIVAESTERGSGIPGQVTPIGSSALMKFGTYELATMGIGPTVTFKQELLGKDVDVRVQLFREIDGHGNRGRGVFFSVGFEF
jgi:hypothetical protein